MGVDPPSSMLASFGVFGAALQNSCISSRLSGASRKTTGWRVQGLGFRVLASPPGSHT